MTPDSEHLEPERPETVKLKVCRYCRVRQGQYPPNGVHVCACEEDGPVWVEIDFVPASSLTSLEAERDEARVFKWSVEDAVIAAVPERIARLRTMVEEWDEAGYPISPELRKLAYEPFDEPVAQTINALARAEAAEARLEAVREWTKNEGQRGYGGDYGAARKHVARLLDPADGGADQFNENPDEFHARPDPETYRGGGVMGRKRPADGGEK